MHVLGLSYPWHYNFPLLRGEGLGYWKLHCKKKGRLGAPIITGKEFRHLSVLRHRALPHQVCFPPDLMALMPPMERNMH